MDTFIKWTCVTIIVLGVSALLVAGLDNSVDAMEFYDHQMANCKEISQDAKLLPEDYDEFMVACLQSY
jgi:hypothetical protein